MRLRNTIGIDVKRGNFPYNQPFSKPYYLGQEEDAIWQMCGLLRPEQS